MNRYLFVGPSLPDIRSCDDITVRPPVAAGDLIELDVEVGDAVGIIDGYFHQAQAVPHKEILDLMARGATVFGAASIGALRAAELADHGMVGVGGIFEDYRDRVLWADDEVALMHGTAEDGYRPLSEPLVNTRAKLVEASRQGLCDPETADRIVGELGAMPYRDRSWRQVVTVAVASGVDDAAAWRLGRFLATSTIDRKRDDARSLVGVLRRAGPGLRSAAPTRTLYLYGWQLAANHSEELAALRMCQVLATDFPSVYGHAVLRWLAEDCRTRCRSGPGNGSGLPEAAVRHGAHVGWYGPDELPGPLGTWVTEHELAGADRVEIVARVLVRSFRVEPGITADELMLAAFRKLPGYAQALGLADRVSAINELGRRHRPDFDPDEMAEDQVLRWLAERWEVAPAALDIAANDRGFPSAQAAAVTARTVFLAASCDSFLADFRIGTENAHQSSTGRSPEIAMPPEGVSADAELSRGI
ncbi:TfuA-like protein [Virgisporangium ochraceum]